LYGKVEPHGSNDQTAALDKCSLGSKKEKTIHVKIDQNIFVLPKFLKNDKIMEFVDCLWISLWKRLINVIS